MEGSKKKSHLCIPRQLAAPDTIAQKIQSLIDDALRLQPSKKGHYEPMNQVLNNATFPGAFKSISICATTSDAHKVFGRFDVARHRAFLFVVYGGGNTSWWAAPELLACDVHP